MNGRWSDRGWPLDPVAFTFFASLLLSAIAVATGSLNRDGMLYVEVARAFVEGGLPAAKAIYSWPLLPVIMGALSMATGIPPEWCGHLLNAAFMAGACALTVSMIRREYAELAWFGAAIVLALPGLNEYRNELIREYGCWFFTMLAFRLAQEWPSKPAWPLAMAIQFAIFAAALFRPEAALFFAAIVAWQSFQASPVPRITRTMLLTSIPMLLMAAGIVAHFAGLLPSSQRLAFEMSRFNYSAFDQTAQGVAQALNPYARNEQKTAHAILFFGSIALVPWKFLAKLGVFIIPLWLFLVSPMRREYHLSFAQHSWAFAFQTLAICIVALQLQFVAGRYIGPLLLFSTPFLAHGLERLCERIPRFPGAPLILCAMLAIANVVSPVGDKRYFSDAGHWLKDNVSPSDGIYIQDPRIAHYAGWSYSKTMNSVLRDDGVKAGVADGRFDILVMHITKDNASFQDWAAQSGLNELRRFPDKSGKNIVIYSTQIRQADRHRLE